MSVFFPLLVFLIALVLQGLFAGYETGFVSTNSIRLRYLAEEEHSSRAASLLRHIGRPDQMLSTLLIGTNLMVVTCTLVVSFEVRQLQQFFPPSIAVMLNDVISTAIVAPVMLVFAEIIPKSVFRIHSNLTITMFPVIQFFYALLAPVAAPTAWATRGLLRLFGAHQHHMRTLMSSREDVRDLVDEGVDHGTIKPDEQEMIHSVIDMQATTAREIMVPRIAVQALPDTATRGELLAMLVETGRSRIPIYRDSMDHVIGVASAYGILRDVEPEREDIARFIREIMHVPDTMCVDDLFQEMKKQRQHMAIVTDEYGGTDGLVTIEDILEEIFGEIQDEYDNEESPIHKLGPNAYVVDARTPLGQAAEVLGIPIEDDEVETVGGWLMHVAGHIPSQGHVVEHGRFRMTVLDGGPNFVSRIRLEILPGTAAWLKFRIRGRETRGEAAQVTAIATRGLTKVYKRHLGKRGEASLDNLNLDVGRNEVFGFLGRNGAGKTTAIKLLCSLLHPTRGEAFIMGKNVRTPEARRTVGYLPENPYFYEYLTPRETLDFYGRLQGLDARDRAAEWKKLSELLDLTEIAGQRVREFSKGMRQRLGFAVALVGDPEILILDEPMSGLDPLGRRAIREIMLKLRDEKKTLFFSSHVLGNVEQICDRVGILVKGKLAVQGRLDRLLANAIEQVEVIASGLDAGAISEIAARSVSTRTSEAGTHFRVADTGAANDAVRAIHASGGRLVEFTPIKESLEDYFMRNQELRT